MTRAKISQYSATANDNTDVNGVNIAEGCPPSSMNNMGREIMAALKRFQVGSDGDGVTVGGSLVVSGSTSVNTFNVDVISEKTSAAGVTVDGVLLKDSGVVTGAGTASAPVYSTTGDTNTGIFFPAADTIAFAEGGAEAMRITSSGNVGIGTSSPAQRLHLVGASSSSARTRVENASGYLIDVYAGVSDGTGLLTGNNPMFFEVNGTERMRIDSSGNVGIGTSTPTDPLTIQANTGASAIRIIGRSSFDNSRIDFYNNANNSRIVGLAAGVADFSIYVDANIPLVFATNNAERARITSGGVLLVGTTSSANANFLIESSKSGTNYINCRSTSISNGNAAGFIATGGGRDSELGVYKHSGITNPASYLVLQREDGTVPLYWTGNDGNFRVSTSAGDIGTNNGTVVGTQTSDERLKNISGPVTYGLNEVLAIEPISFAFKDRPDFQKIGFSAQQVQPIVPEAVYDTGECIDGYDVDPENSKLQTPKSDRTKLAMEYTQLIPVLVKAIQELKAELDTVKAELAALKGQ